jgi:hypothetical protein
MKHNNNNDFYSNIIDFDKIKKEITNLHSTNKTLDDFFKNNNIVLNKEILAEVSLKDLIRKCGV